MPHTAELANERGVRERVRQGGGQGVRERSGEPLANEGRSRTYPRVRPPRGEGIFGHFIFLIVLQLWFVRFAFVIFPDASNHLSPKKQSTHCRFLKQQHFVQY